MCHSSDAVGRQRSLGRAGTLRSIRTDQVYLQQAWFLCSVNAGGHGEHFGDLGFSKLRQKRPTWPALEGTYVFTGQQQPRTTNFKTHRTDIAVRHIAAQTKNSHSQGPLQALQYQYLAD